MTEVFAVRQLQDAALDVVFIHGLDGDARGSWSRGDTDSFWPQWLTEEFENISVWTVDYNAWSSKWRGQSMSLPDRRNNLMTQLQNHGLSERPLCFIAHSMGGLLVKDILLHAAEGRTEFAPFANATKGVVFLATPHTGSGLTKAVNALRLIYRATPAVDDLERNSFYLRDLSDRYRDWVDDAKIHNLVFFETYPTYGARVVDETSANPGIAGIRPIAVDANHLSICKPDARSNIIYGRVKRFIATLLKAPSTALLEGVPEATDLGAHTETGRVSRAITIAPDEAPPSGIMAPASTWADRGLIGIDRSRQASATVLTVRSNSHNPGVESQDERSEWPEGLPPFRWPIANHAEAQVAFCALLLRSSQFRLLCVDGASETGKSSLAKLMERNVAELLPELRCGRFDFKGAIGRRVEVDAFAQALGFSCSDDKADGDQLSQVLGKVLEVPRPTVLIFDSYEDAGDARVYIERIFLPKLLRETWLRVVILGQQVPAAQDWVWESIAAAAISLELPDVEAWLDYGRRLRPNDADIDLEFVARIHRVTRGKPTALATVLRPTR